MKLADPETEARVLSSDVEDRALGDAILMGLSRSRLVTSKVVHDWYRSSSIRYEARVAMMLARFKYKSRRAMFKTMKSCSITLKPAGFELCPLKHDKLEGWGRTVGDGIEDVHLPRDATPAKIGCGLEARFRSLPLKRVGHPAAVHCGRVATDLVPPAGPAMPRPRTA